MDLTESNLTSNANTSRRTLLRLGLATTFLGAAACERHLGSLVTPQNILPVRRSDPMNWITIADMAPGTSAVVQAGTHWGEVMQAEPGIVVMRHRADTAPEMKRSGEVILRNRDNIKHTFELGS